jgi:hypothetical protein
MRRRRISILGTLAVLSMVLLMAVPVSAKGRGNTLLVGPGQEYSTIQAAVDAAKKGSKILVFPGTYVEAVSVSKNNLKIVAQGDGVIVEAPLGQPAGFAVNADHVTIRGFEIAAGGEYGNDCTNGIIFEGSHNTFADNDIYANRSCIWGVDAITCYDEDGGSDYNTIEDNTIHAIDGGIGMGAGGSEHEDAINHGNVIRNNSLQQLTMNAISFWNARDFLVAGNQIDRIDGTCIYAGTSVGNKIVQGRHRIEGNTMGTCAFNGIYLQAYDGGILTHNRIAENTAETCGWECILLEGQEGAILTRNRIADNRVENCGWEDLQGTDYISLVAREGAFLTGNVVSNNEASLAKVCGVGLGADWDATDATVADNLISGNLAYHNLSGICLNLKADENKVQKNRSQDNTAGGIVVFGNSNRLTSNLVLDNVDSGIEVVGDSNAMVKNTALHNGLDLDDKGTGNVWRKNTYDTANWE